MPKVPKVKKTQAKKPPRNSLKPAKGAKACKNMDTNRADNAMLSLTDIDIGVGVRDSEVDAEAQDSEAADSECDEFHEDHND